jgi:hypothetical protein
MGKSIMNLLIGFLVVCFFSENVQAYSLIFFGSAGLGFVAQMVGSSLGMAYSTL